MKKNYKATILATVIAASVVFVAFLTSQFLLENKAKTVLFGHTQLAMLDN